MKSGVFIHFMITDEQMFPKENKSNLQLKRILCFCQNREGRMMYLFPFWNCEKSDEFNR